VPRRPRVRAADLSDGTEEGANGGRVAADHAAPLAAHAHARACYAPGQQAPRALHARRASAACRKGRLARRGAAHAPLVTRSAGHQGGPHHSAVARHADRRRTPGDLHGRGTPALSAALVPSRARSEPSGVTWARSATAFYALR